MARSPIRLAGVELYFDDLRKARRFYRDVLGLPLSGEAPGHHAQFATSRGFVCLESKGAENYPSRDKAVVFLEVPNVAAAVKAIGRRRFVHVKIAAPSRAPTGARYGTPDTERARPRSAPRASSGASWAVLHDPEGHSVLLLERPQRRRTSLGVRRHHR